MIRVSTSGLILALALTGCGAGQTDTGSDGEPMVGIINKVDSAHDIALPMDAYSFSEREDRTIARAAHLLVENCGDRFGVQITMPPAQNPSPVSLVARRYFLLDPSEAAQYGYNLPPSGLQEDYKADGGGWNPSEREFAVATGDTARGAAAIRDEGGAALPEGGCTGEAARTLGDPPAGADEVVRLANDAYDRAESDSRVVAAFAAWSLCMKRSGFLYNTPREPNNIDWPDPAGAEEIATAETDVACKVETNLAGIWMTVEAAYQQRQIEDYAQELSNIKAWRDDRLRRASQALEAS